MAGRRRQYDLYSRDAAAVVDFYTAHNTIILYTFWVAIVLYRVRRGVWTTRVDAVGGGGVRQTAEIEYGADDTMSNRASHLQRRR